MADELERLKRALAGRYEIHHELGRGGMATVYRAHDLKHDRPVAMKFLRPELAAALGAGRFLREITLTARLDHPHILPLLDSGEADGLLYYVMPYVEGESLRDRLDREKQLPLEDAFQITREVADALSYAHGHGIVHRDIKPENILLAGAHARVADFGIARAVTAAGADALTQTGIAVGTPVYMSPEQAAGDRTLDARSDVYSLGCVAYEMLAGEPPFTGATPEAILARKSLEAVPSLRVVREAVPLGVQEAVAKALSKVPADRFVTASEFAQALTRGRSAREVVPLAPGRMARWRLLIAAAAALVALAVGSWSITRLGQPSPGINSLAVLPLKNLMGDPEQEYFVEGMHETLTAELSKINALKVISRTSTMRYRDADKAMPQIARELGVEGLIEGSVSREGDQVRVTLQLIHGPSDRHLWAETYQRELRGILALQNEVARDVAQAIRVTLTPEESGRPTSARVVNPASYDAYLRAVYHLSRGTAEALSRGEAELQRAVRLDPLFAKAYARLADVYVWAGYIGYSGWPAGRAAFTTARAALTRAFQLDGSLPEAHLALGRLRWMYDRDVRASERALRRALELDPSLADAHGELGRVLAIQGHYEAAVAVAERARELDPMVAERHGYAALVYFLARRYDDAIRIAHDAIALDPTAPTAYQALGGAYVEKGRYTDALAAFEDGFERSGGNRIFLGHLGYAYARVGRTADARRILTELQHLHRAGLASPYYVAWTYLGLSKRDSALSWLETTENGGYGHILFLRANPVWEQLRSEPRFQALLAKAGLQ